MTKKQFLTAVQDLEQKPKKPWIDFISEKVYSGKPGIYYLNRFIADIANKYPCGFYQYTTEPAFKKNEYKCGQTSKYAIERIHGQREAGEREVYVIVGWIPSDLAEIKNEDQRILLEMHNQKKCTLSKVLNPDMTTKEWAYFANDNPEEVWREYLGSHAKKFELALTIWQLETLDTILSFLGEGMKKIMAELAARFGKTLLYLSMFLAVKHKIMVIGTYYLSALSSFKKEISRYSEFSNMITLELSSPTFQEDFNQGLNDDKKIVVLSSLCGDKTADETVRNQNAQFIENFTDKITVIDEADYGAHTESCVPFVNRIGQGAPVILTTGTNSERAKGDHNDLDAFLSCTYFDQLMRAGKTANIKNEIVKTFKRAKGFENNLAKVQFYRYDWSRFVSYIDGHEVELNPSFAKCSRDVQKNHGFWTGLYQSLIGQSPIMDANDYSIFNCLENDSPRSAMQFVSMNNSQLKKLESIAHTVLNQFYDVYVINGEVTTNEQAEQFVKDKIRIAEHKGKHVWIIASNMGQRSFSVAEINVVLLTYDSGDLGATVQKMSRALTTGDSEKIGHIISLSIDGTRDDKIAPMILDAAIKVAENEGIDIVSALRKVMKTLPIFQMCEDGYNMQLEVDEYSKEIFSSSNSHRIVMNNERLMYDGCLDSIELDTTNAEKMKAVSDFQKGKTNLESQDSGVGMTSEENKIFRQRQNKLATILDRTAYCIKEIRKHFEVTNYQSFVDILNTNHFVSDSIGVSANEFEMLVEDRYIDLSLFSIYVESVN